MATFAKSKLSGSTSGQPILVVATTDPGTLIHTATASTSANVWDEVWIYAHNTSTSAVDLTIEYGGNGTANLITTTSLPPKSGLLLVCPGLILQNSLTVKAYAGTTNVIAISGFVNSIT